MRFLNAPRWLPFGLVLLCAAPVSRADDASAKAKLDTARALYAERATAGKVEEALTLLTAAEGEAEDADLKYDILILTCSSHYWRGTHAVGDKAKIPFFDAGYKTAEKARGINADYADALYWSASNLARWAEANGALASLGKKKELEKTLNGILDRNTKAGDPGETYWNWGADRTMGRLYFKAPPFAGGSLALALKHLERAYNGQKNFVLSVMWYAEALFQGNASDKTKARAILDELLAKDPATLNPGFGPETADEWPNARKLRAEMGNE